MSRVNCNSSRLNFCFALIYCSMHDFDLAIISSYHFETKFIGVYEFVIYSIAGTKRRREMIEKNNNNNKIHMRSEFVCGISLIINKIIRNSTERLTKITFSLRFMIESNKKGNPITKWLFSILIIKQLAFCMCENFAIINPW